MKQMLRRQNSAAMFLTHVSPASLLAGSAIYIDAIQSEMLKKRR
jgi:hypothetical protein